MHWRVQLLVLFTFCLVVFLVQKNYLSGHRVSAPPYNKTTVPNAAIVMVSPLRDVRAGIEKIFSGSPVTHVGLIWVDAAGRPFLFHTERTLGAHLEPFHTWLRQTPNQQVFIRCVTGVDVSGAALESAITPYLSTRYSFGFWKAVLQFWWPGVEMPRATSPKDRFCSELIAEVLHHVGVLHFEDDTIVPRLILPYDFWDTHRLPYTPNVYLGPVEEITAMHALDITAMHVVHA